MKEKQYEVLKSVIIENKDVLAVLPTGYGKSLIYQPACTRLQSHGLRWITKRQKLDGYCISLLNALIRDQIVKMKEGGLNVSVLRWHRAHTEDGGDDDHDISLDVPVEILSSTHFNLTNTHLEVLVDNKKVSKLLTTPAFNQKVKAIVVGEAHLIVDW